MDLRDLGDWVPDEVRVLFDWSSGNEAILVGCQRYGHIDEVVDWDRWAQQLAQQRPRP
jgi:hypothetical protein